MIAAARRYGWQFILLRPSSKEPYTPEGHHVYAPDVRAWVSHGGNIGLTGTNLAILDWDDEDGRRLLFEGLGPLPLTVRTGSGKFHTYVAGDPTLPGGIYLLGGGRKVGDIRRLPTEYVVCPPSIHPNGEPYQLAVDELILEPLPEAWRTYLHASVPAWTKPGEPFEIPDGMIDKGNRHLFVFRLTRSWKARGHSLAEAIQIARLANEHKLKSPLDDYHLVHEVTRAYRRADREEFAR